MKCSCGKTLPTGAQKCPGCGKEVATSYSYDLLPDEEPKKDEKEDAFKLPSGASMPPPIDLPGPGSVKQGRSSFGGDRQRGASLNKGGLSMFKLGIGGAVVLIVILLGMRMCGGPGVKITGNPKGEGSPTVFSTTPKSYPIQLVGEASYTFTVEALDGDVTIGFVSRSARDRISPEVIKTWTLTPVRKGDSQTIEGTVNTGSYSFVILTDSKKSVKVKYKYKIG